MHRHFGYQVLEPEMVCFKYMKCIPVVVIFMFRLIVPNYIEQDNQQYNSFFMIVTVGALYISGA